MCACVGIYKDSEIQEPHHFFDTRLRGHFIAMGFPEIEKILCAHLTSMGLASVLEYMIQDGVLDRAITNILFRNCGRKIVIHLLVCWIRDDEERYKSFIGALLHTKQVKLAFHVMSEAPQNKSKKECYDEVD